MVLVISRNSVTFRSFYNFLVATLLAGVQFSSSSNQLALSSRPFTSPGGLFLVYLLTLCFPSPWAAEQTGISVFIESKVSNLIF